MGVHKVVFLMPIWQTKITWDFPNSLLSSFKVVSFMTGINSKNVVSAGTQHLSVHLLCSMWSSNWQTGAVVACADLFAQE